MLSRNRLGVSVVVVVLGKGLSGDGIAAEPAQPALGEAEAGAVQRVDAGAAVAAVGDQARPLERLQMARGGGPRMGEEAGDSTGRHGPAGEVQTGEDPPPRRMGKGFEH